MEKRVVLLVVLCVAVFVGWSLLIQALYPAKPVPVPTPQANAGAPPAPVPTRPEPPPPPPREPGPSRQPQETVKESRLFNKKVSLVLTNKGAGIRSGKILVAGLEDVDLLRTFDAEVPHLALTADNAEADLSRAAWSVTGESERSVTYLYRLGNGVNIEKKFTLGEESHELQMVVTLRNSPSGAPQKVRLRLVALTGLEHDSPYRFDYYGNGFVATVLDGSRAMQTIPYDRPLKEGKPVEVRIPDEERKAGRRVDWFGLRNRYATAILRTPESPEWIDSVVFKPTTQDTPPAGKLKALGVEAASQELEVREGSNVGTFYLYLGPVRKEELAVVTGASDHMLSYGCWGLFNPIGRLILWIVGVAHQVTGNYGWAIILTTLAVRLCLFPLTKKSQTSMARMAQLQPKINIIRERFADDPPRQQAETMKLFKEEKVNPLSGCFPIMLQLPIFIGLYSVLDISLEFRHAPFLAWIHDLSQPDRLIIFGKPVNLLVTALHEFNLVPLVMTITWFLQAYFAPKPQDPKMAAQQRMMMFMPVLFGLFCYSLASGLSLYLFVNSLLAMIEQRVIKKYFLPAGARPGMNSPTDPAVIP